MGTEAVGKVLAQGVVVEPLHERVARELRETEPGGEIQTEVVVKAVDSGKHESPAEIGAGVAGTGREQGHDGLAVAVEDLFRELDRLGAAVALDLALVRVELQLPRGTILDEALRHRHEPRLHPFAQQLRIALEADAQVPRRIAVTDEEPSPRGTVGHGLACQRRDFLAQHPVHGRRPGVEFRVQPLRSRRKRALDQERRSRSRFEGHGRFRGAARERHDQLVKEPSFRSFRAQFVRRRKELSQRDVRTIAHELDDRVECERILEIDEQLVVPFRETHAAGQPPHFAEPPRELTAHDIRRSTGSGRVRAAPARASAEARPTRCSPLLISLACRSHSSARWNAD